MPVSWVLLRERGALLVTKTAEDVPECRVLNNLARAADTVHVRQPLRIHERSKRALDFRQLVIEGARGAEGAASGDAQIVETAHAFNNGRPRQRTT